MGLAEPCVAVDEQWVVGPCRAICDSRCCSVGEAVAFADDERIAMESRISISLRQDFLAAIETTTEDFARGILQEHPEAANKLVDSVHSLEDATSLLRLNMKAEAMLETFLLQSLRIWSS